jgi:DNA-binding NtrC family response regulator
VSEAMQPQRVLVVDDDNATRVGLAELLENAGYETISTESFQQALSILRSTPPDVLITDVRLNEYNGLQLVIARPESVAAIVITGHIDPVLELETRRQGAEYILKPVDPRQLLDLVTSLLERKAVKHER